MSGLHRPLPAVRGTCAERSWPIARSLAFRESAVD